MKDFLRVSLLALTGLLSCVPACAQSDDVPLGDLARSLRKHQAPPRAVIDNDNLSDVMEKGEDRRWASGSVSSRERAATEFVRNNSPDVTCALSFSGQSDVLGPDLHPEALPDGEIGKLEGPASIVGESLQVSIHNGSNWGLREVTVGLTLVDRAAPTYREIDGFRLVPATLSSPLPREKNRETTILYHMKGVGAPATTTLFQAPLNVSIGPDQEWHWAIVQAKGVPPATNAETPGNDAPILQAPD